MTYISIKYAYTLSMLFFDPVMNRYYSLSSKSSNSLYLYYAYVTFFWTYPFLISLSNSLFAPFVYLRWFCRCVYKVHPIVLLCFCSLSTPFFAYAYTLIFPKNNEEKQEKEEDEEEDKEEDTEEEEKVEGGGGRRCGALVLLFASLTRPLKVPSTMCQPINPRKQLQHRKKSHKNWSLATSVVACVCIYYVSVCLSSASLIFFCVHCFSRVLCSLYLYQNMKDPRSSKPLKLNIGIISSSRGRKSTIWATQM